MSPITLQIDEFLAQQQDRDEEDDDEEEEQEQDASARGSGLGSQLSPQLAEFLGVSSMPRTQVVKKIWEYIKENNLQDPKNKRRILLDDKLQTIFTPPMDMFSMNKQLSKHVYTEEPAGASSKPRAKAKPKAKAEKRAAAGDKQPKGSKKQKREGELLMLLMPVMTLTLLCLMPCTSICAR
jgi:upstream activation factor subunit UAF30